MDSNKKTPTIYKTVSDRDFNLETRSDRLCWTFCWKSTDTKQLLITFPWLKRNGQKKNYKIFKDNIGYIPCYFKPQLRLLQKNSIENIYFDYISTKELGFMNRGSR